MGVAFDGDGDDAAAAGGDLLGMSGDMIPIPILRAETWVLEVWFAGWCGQVRA